MGPVRRRVAAAGTVTACCFLGLGATARAAGAGQAARQADPAGLSGGGRPGRVLAFLSTDTARVGEPFVLGVAVEVADSAVGFPSVLAGGERYEQLGGVSVEARAAGGQRALYRLVAWKAGPLELPAVRVVTGAGPVAVTPPPLVVTSVLPADPRARLKLRPPRPPIEVRTFPWLLFLLALLAALLLLWWLLRRRRTGAAEPAPADPGVLARMELERLRGAVEARSIPLPEFYDGVERVVRAYLVARRGWSPVRPVRQLSSERADGWRRAGDARLAHIQERAALVRFAALDAARTAAVEDAEACLAWLREAEIGEAVEDAGEEEATR